MIRTNGEGVVLERGSAARRIVGAVALVGSSLLFGVATGTSVVAWWIALAALGGFGAYLLAARSGFRLDPRARTIVSWWRVGPFGSEEPKRVDGFEEVVVRREVVRSNRSTTVRYPVRLVGEREELRLFAFADPALARRFAEAIARVLWKPIRSDVAGAVVVRAPEHLDASLVERLAAERGTPARPEQASGSRLVVEERGDGITIRVPPIGAARSGLWLMVLALPPALAAPALAFGFARSAPLAVQILFVSLSVVPFLSGGALCLLRGRATTRLDAAGGTLRIERCVLGVPRVTAVDSSAIEEVVVAEPNGGALGGLVATGAVTLIADHGLFSIGRGLSRDDLHDLARLVTWALCVTAHPRVRGAGTSRPRQPATGNR